MQIISRIPDSIRSYLSHKLCSYLYPYQYYMPDDLVDKYNSTLNKKIINTYYKIKLIIHIKLIYLNYKLDPDAETIDE